MSSRAGTAHAAALLALADGLELQARTLRTLAGLDAAPASADPAPFIITKVNAHLVGMTGPELTRAVRGMRADPRLEIRQGTIAHGKSFRGATPAALMEYLRSAPIAAKGDGAIDVLVGDEDADVKALLAEAGLERVPSSAPRARRKGTR